MKSIRLRLLVLVVSALLPAFLAAGWVIGQAFRNEKALVEGSLRDTTRALSMMVGRDLPRRTDLARVLAESQLLDRGAGISAQDLVRFRLQARRAMAPMSGWIELHSAEGLLLSTLALSTETSAAPNADSTQLLLDTPSIQSLQDAGDGMGFHANVVQPVQPVRRGGRTVLNLRVIILPQEVQALIDSQTLPQDSVATILDDRGTVVARHPGGARFLGAKATPDILERFRGQKEGLFEFVSLDGVPTIGYFSRSPQGWTYLSALPRER